MGAVGGPRAIRTGHGGEVAERSSANNLLCGVSFPQQLLNFPTQKRKYFPFKMHDHIEIDRSQES